MATVILQGGLGNQLFQYAAGRALAHRTNADLYLVPSLVSKKISPEIPRRSFHLSRFNIRGETVDSSLSENVFVKARIRAFRLLRTLSPPLAARISKVYVDQHPRRFSQQVLELPEDVILLGYYQSEDYFRNVADALRAELTLNEKPTSKNRRWQKTLNGQNSVGVHVRRGDYTAHGWQLSAKYYRSAIRSLTYRRDDISLFFFSDDMEWVRKNIDALLPSALNEEKVKYVDANSPQQPVEDLRLLKSCNHNVISNSTFSWWAAWLNPNDDKTVLAPSYWLRDRVEDLDLIPDRWTTVDWR